VAVARAEAAAGGRGAQGEQQLVEALRAMGFEGRCGQLKRAGLRTVEDLCQGIDEARLAAVCPDMQRPQRRWTSPAPGRPPRPPARPAPGPARPRIDNSD
jgi:hypothetical protein